MTWKNCFIACQLVAFGLAVVHSNVCITEQNVPSYSFPHHCPPSVRTFFGDLHLHNHMFCLKIQSRKANEYSDSQKISILIPLREHTQLFPHSNACKHRTRCHLSSKLAVWHFFVEVVLLWGLFIQPYSGHVEAVMRMNADAFSTLFPLSVTRSLCSPGFARCMKAP